MNLATVKKLIEAHLPTFFHYLSPHIPWLITVEDSVFVIEEDLEAIRTRLSVRARTMSEDVDIILIMEDNLYKKKMAKLQEMSRAHKLNRDIELSLPGKGNA